MSPTAACGINSASIRDYLETTKDAVPVPSLSAVAILDGLFTQTNFLVYETITQIQPRPSSSPVVRLVGPGAHQSHRSDIPLNLDEFQ
jgi:hypothetical protein